MLVVFQARIWLDGTVCRTQSGAVEELRSRSEGSLDVGGIKKILRVEAANGRRKREMGSFGEIGSVC